MPDKNKKSNSYYSFEKEVTQIYRDLGAEVEHDKNVSGLQIDVFVCHQTPDGLLVRTAVECKAYKRPLGVNEALKACERLARLKELRMVETGVIVSKSGFTHDARVHCHESGISCIEFADLKRKVIDFEKYLADVEEYYSSLEVGQRNLYIELSGTTEKGKKIPSVTEFIETWIEGPGRLLTILGEYGSGKTTTCWHVAQNLGRRYRISPLTERIPIIIELRQFGQHFNIRGFLTDFLMNQYETRLRSYSDFEKYNREGRFVLLFDAFDEISVRSDFGLFKHHLSDIQSLARGKAKVILTCRTSLFRDALDLERMHMGAELYDSLHKHKTYQVIFLSSFSEAQIQEYVNKYYGGGWIDFFLKLEKHENLISLASRPILLNLLAKSVKSAKHFDFLTPIRLYKQAIDSWIERDDWRCRLTPSQRSLISQKLAYTLLTEKRPTLHHEELINVVAEHFGDRNFSEEIIDQYNHEVRLCSFLRNDLQGFYGFVHKSFSEFLAAEYIINQVAQGKYEVLGQDLSLETLEFLAELVALEPDRLVSYFWDALSVSNDRLEASILSKAKGHATFVLSKSGADLNNADLSDITFPSMAVIQDLYLVGSKLSRIIGMGVIFDNAEIMNADLSGAQLTTCSFINAKLSHANFRNANLSGSSFVAADLTGADLRDTQLKGVFIAPEDGVDLFIQKSFPNVSQAASNLLSSIRAARWLKKSHENDPFLSELSEFNLEGRDTHALDRVIKKAVGIRQNIGSHFLVELEKSKNTISNAEQEIAHMYSIRDQDQMIRLPIQKLETKKRKSRRRQKSMILQWELIQKRVELFEKTIVAFKQGLKRQLTTGIQTEALVQGAQFRDSVGLKRNQVIWLKKKGADFRN